MNPFARLIHWLRRARLAMAEQDLRWMEEIGRHNLERQRAHVAQLRRRLASCDTHAVDDIARHIAHQGKRPLLGDRP